MARVPSITRREMLAGLATLGASGGTSGAGLLGTAMRLFILLMVWVVGGLLVVPRLMRFIVRLKRPETTLVASLGICFAFALLAQYLGYSVALGAFIVRHPALVPASVYRGRHIAR